MRKFSFNCVITINDDGSHKPDATIEIPPPGLPPIAHGVCLGMVAKLVASMAAETVGVIERERGGEQAEQFLRGLELADKFEPGKSGVTTSQVGEKGPTQ